MRARKEMRHGEEKENAARAQHRNGGVLPDYRTSWSHLRDAMEPCGDALSPESPNHLRRGLETHLYSGTKGWGCGGHSSLYTHLCSHTSPV